MNWEGFAYAAGAAISHSCIDGSRKMASQKFSSKELVGLIALLDAVFLSCILYFYGNFDTSIFLHMDTEFVIILIVTAVIKVIVGFMYQRALQVSPLSVTVPYLAFTPVLLVFTSYILVHEMPGMQGLFGVLIVTLGGYLLAAEVPEDADNRKERLPKSSVSSKSLMSLIPSMSGTLFKAGDKGSRLIALEQQPKELMKIESSDCLVAEKEEKKSASWWSRSVWPMFVKLFGPLLALRKEEGSLLMLGVAGLLSVSNSLDKIGAHLAPSLLAFAALQRILMAIPVILFLLYKSPRSFEHLIHYFPLLTSISFFEIAAFIFYLKSLELLLVSYAVAAKRSNVLISVLIGKVVFKEKIWKRLPFVIMMLGGMSLILFAPV